MNKFLILIGFFVVLVLVSCSNETADEQEEIYTISTGTGSTGSTGGGKD